MSIDAIIGNSKGLQDKFVIEAYILLGNILFLTSKDVTGAYEACCKILAILGVKVSFLEGDEYYLSDQIARTKTMLEDYDFSCIQNRTKDWKTLTIMEAFGLLAILANHVRLDLVGCIIVRWAQYTVTNGVFCHLTSRCVVLFGALLCNDLGEYTTAGYSIGKKGMELLNGPCSPELPGVFFVFYG